MPVTDRHPEYEACLPLWRKCRDVAAGEDWLKDPARRELYVYRPPGMKNDDRGYDDYVKRAHFYDATGRTVDGLTGLLERKAPSWKVPAEMTSWLDDVTGRGINLTEFASQVDRELVTVRRCGVLVDFPEVERKERVVAEAEKMNLRPSLQLFPAESITNWRWKRVGSNDVLTMVTAHEWADADGRDEFSWATVEQYRVFDLDPAGFYRIRRFRYQEIQGKKGWFQYGPSSYPRRDGRFLFEVQFDFYGTPWTRKPWLLGLANANLSHLNLSADHRRALRIVGSPQPYIVGYKPSVEEGQQGEGVTAPQLAGAAGVEKEWVFGSDSLWTFVNENAKLDMLVAKSDDISAIPEAMKVLREEMITLGARLLGFDKNVAETAQVEVVRRQGDNSALASIAEEASKGLSKSATRVRDWLSRKKGECWVAVNTKFFDTPMTPDEAAAQVALWQAGMVAKKDVRQKLRDGEMLDPERTDVEIDADLEQEAPAPVTVDPKLAAAAQAAMLAGGTKAKKTKKGKPPADPAAAASAGQAEEDQAA